MPFLFNDTTSKFNPFSGNPTLSATANTATFDGSCNLDFSLQYSINFLVITNHETFDGSCNLDSSLQYPIATQP